MSAVIPVLPSLVDAARALTVIEVGAGLGVETGALRLMFPRARIHALEPDPRNAHVLRTQFAGRGVEVVEAAASDTDGSATLHLSSGARPRSAEEPPPRGGAPREWTTASSLREPAEHLRRLPWVTFEGRARVKTVRLDSYVESRRPALRYIDVLWVSAQGAEDQVLAGATRTLERTRVLAIEYAETEMFRGQIGLAAIRERLGPAWTLVGTGGPRALLKNDGAFGGMYL